ncbi:MAG: hypothetical protein IJI14_17120 [Anaerolineaceae bacterium]|nr:hypothetical protein [Anaerolineaceae bacterium]
MYKRSNTINQEQMAKDDEVKKEGELQKKTSQLGPQIGNEAVLQMLSGDDSGNNGGAGKGASLMVDALIDPKRSNEVIKDIVLPKKTEKKAEDQNKALPPAAAPKKKKPLFYKDPENLKQDNLNISAPENYPVPDDMAVEMDASDLQNVSYVEKSKEPEDEEDMLIPPDPKEKKIKHSLDYEEINEDMYPVKDWNFTPQKMEEVKTTSGFAKFKNKLAHIFGKVFGFLSSAFGFKQSITAIRRYAADKKKRALNASPDTRIQDKRDHSAIPGWEGAKFDPNADSGEEILADFRRVPTVWSKLTADKASEGEGEDEKPLPPTISIYIDQPKDNSSQSMNFVEIGHSMIGIEYSRFSQISQRYERYKLKYGFYPSSIAGTVSGVLALAGKDVVVPGRMSNDEDHQYSVSRRYPATAKQVNAILKASETYADGGYGYYARNCATFVKDMAQIAHLPVSDKLFEKEEVGFSDIANSARIGTEISGENSQISVEERMLNYSQQKDESYANYGNKRATEQDFEHFNESVRSGPAEKKETYIPGAIGEKLRRETTGEIGSEKYSGNVKDNHDVETIRAEINRHGKELADIILGGILKGVRNPATELPAELWGILSELPLCGEIFYSVASKRKEKKKASIKKIQSARQEMTAFISSLNKLYFQYFKGDKRLQEPVMNLISLINMGINVLDEDYEAAFNTQNYDEDLGRFPRKMYEIQEITSGEKSVDITPSQYEAYLQLYKNPKDAINAIDRYIDLERMDKDGSMPSRYKSEWKKRKRIHDLALEFERSHRYMMEKDTYNQQDVDYAFMLNEREDDDNVFGDLLDSSPGKIYLSLILKKVFGGIKERFKTFASQNEENVQDEGTLAKWLDEDLTDSLLKNKNQMLTFTRGLKKSMTKPDKPNVNSDSLLHELGDMLFMNFFKLVFDSNHKGIAPYLQYKLRMVFQNLLSKDPLSQKFQNHLKGIVEQVISEN